MLRFVDRVCRLTDDVPASLLSRDTCDVADGRWVWPLSTAVELVGNVFGGGYGMRNRLMCKWSQISRQTLTKFTWFISAFIICKKKWWFLTCEQYRNKSMVHHSMANQSTQYSLMKLLKYWFKNKNNGPSRPQSEYPISLLVIWAIWKAIVEIPCHWLLFNANSVCYNSPLVCSSPLRKPYQMPVCITSGMFRKRGPRISQRWWTPVLRSAQTVWPAK